MSRSAFFQRMTDLAAIDPCLVPRADLLRLLAMAGLADTHPYQKLARGKSDLVQVDGAGLLKAIEAATGGKAPPGQPAEVQSLLDGPEPGRNPLARSDFTGSDG